jgi:hypothetical protein
MMSGVSDPMLQLKAGRHSRFKTIGCVLITVGILSAFIFWHQKNEEDRLTRESQTQIEPSWQDSPLDFANSKKARRDIEMTYGKIGVLFGTWYYGWRDLSLFDQVAITVSAVSILMGIGFLIAARRI